MLPPSQIQMLMNDFMKGLNTPVIDEPGTDFYKARTAKEALVEVLMPYIREQREEILAERRRPGASETAKPRYTLCCDISWFTTLRRYVLFLGLEISSSKPSAQQARTMELSCKQCNVCSACGTTVVNDSSVCRSTAVVCICSAMPPILLQINTELQSAMCLFCNQSQEVCHVLLHGCPHQHGVPH